MTTRPATPPADKFWSRVDQLGPRECWPWLGAKNSKGYGRWTWNGKRMGAHRVAYLLITGGLPSLLTLDHLCRNRACVNPAHLEPVTATENVMRGIGLGPKNRAKTHCPKGHEYTAENTRLHYSGSGHLSRCCRICLRAKNRDYYQANAKQLNAKRWYVSLDSK